MQNYLTVGGEILVNSTYPYDQNESDVVQLPSGGFAAFWSNSGPHIVRGQYFDASGSKVGAEFNIGSTDPAVHSSLIGVVPLGLGYVLCWDESNPITSQEQIKVQNFASNGGVIGIETVIDLPTWSSLQDAEIATLASGGFVVTWNERASDNTSSLKAQICDGAGNKVGSVIPIDDSHPSELAVAGLSGGGFIVAWVDRSDDETHNIVKAQRFDANGVEIGAEFQPSSDGSDFPQEPTIAALASGGFVLIWTEGATEQDPNGGLRARIYDGDGNPVTSDFDIYPSIISSQSDASATELADGTFLVTWTDWRTAWVEDDPVFGAIRGQILDSNGNKIGNDFLINTTTMGDQRESSVSSLAGGGFVVSWTDTNQFNSPDQDGTQVRAQVFGPTSAGPTDIGLSSTVVSETKIENLVVGKLSATGPITAEYSYSILSDSTGGAFGIEGDKLIVVDNARLDFETAPNVAVTIRTTDNLGNHFDEAFALSVTDASIEELFSASDVILANTKIVDLQQKPDITYLSSGGYLVVWEDRSYSGSYSAIRGQVFDPQGNAVGSEFVANTTLAGDHFQPSATALASGGFAISWTDHTGIGGDASGSAIKAQLFDPTGQKVGSEFLVNSTTPNDQMAPVMVALPNGGFVVAWQSSDGFSGTGIKAQIFNPSGARLGSEFIVSTDQLGASSPDITALATGNFVVTWHEGASLSNVKAQMFTVTGSKIGPEMLVNTVVTGVQANPTIAPLASGGFVICWEDSSGFPDQVIKAQIFDANGSKSGSEFLVGELGDSLYFLYPKVAPLDSGGFVVSWFNDHGMIAQLFDSAGHKVGDVFAIDDELHENSGAISPLPSDRWVVAFTDDAVEGAALSNGIGVRIFAPASDRIGGFGLDTLIGDESANRILGYSGNDTLSGGPGNDRLDGGTGADSMSGGADNDTYVVDNAGDTVAENFGEGTDLVLTDLGVGATQPQRIANMYQLGANLENLTGTALNQGLEGNSLNNVITAGAGADYVDASDGGNDNVSSGDGRDVIYYGAALTNADSNNGGDEGSDARGDLLVIQGDYTITLGADALVDIEKFRVLKGTNTAFGYTDGGTFDYNITAVDANVAAGARLVVQGGSLQLGEHLIFNGAAETDGSFQIFGGHDADALIGGAQGDHLLGRSGDDTLTGNGGADRLRGGLGGDTMDGGTGADTFVYAAQGGDEPYAVAALESTGLNYDTIVGFSFAEDKIDLPGSVSSLASVNGGTLNDASFNADLAAAVDASLAANGAVLFTANNGGHSGETFLVVDADGNGSYQANLDFVIQLQNMVGTPPASPDFFM